MFLALTVGFVIGGWSVSNDAPRQQQTQRADGARRNADAPLSAINQGDASKGALGTEEKEGHTTWSWLSNFFELKLTDAIIAIFTIVLALKTSGLFKETAGLRSAADKQAKDMEASTKAATDAANAAITSNQIAVYNAEQELRAYVFVKNMTLERERRPGTLSGSGHVIPGLVHTYRFNIIWENSAPTPARTGRRSGGSCVCSIRARLLLLRAWG